MYGLAIKSANGIKNMITGYTIVNSRSTPDDPAIRDPRP